MSDIHIERMSATSYKFSSPSSSAAEDSRHRMPKVVQRTFIRTEVDWHDKVSHIAAEFASRVLGDHAPPLTPGHRLSWRVFV